MKIDYARLSDHELQVAVEVMDINWHDVMKGKDADYHCMVCGTVCPAPAPDFVKDYVFERSRAVEEQQRRLHGPDAGNYVSPMTDEEIDASFERASDAWARRAAAQLEATEDSDG
jgi:hypothetical protein